MNCTDSMDRRGFLRSCGLGAAALACSSLARGADRSPARPNVLFIICDDLNDWALHPPDHPKAKTPNMDRLRKKSVNFANAHVVVPVCGPSRKCLFSGLYPQTLDDYSFARWNSVRALRGCTPLPLHFRNNGYDAYGTGKLLHEGAGGDFYTDYGIGPDYGPWPWYGKGRAFNTPHPAQYGAWIKHLPVKMHRDLNYGPLSNVPHWKKGAIKGIPGAKGWYTEAGKPFRYVDAKDRDLTPDEVSADWAANILKSKRDRPFYLAVGFIRPHTPLYAPKKYFDMFPLEDVQLPPLLKNDLADCAPVLRSRWRWGYTKYEALIKAGGKKALKEWARAYLACMAFVDAQVGKVLDALDASGHSDNTIVVLTGDNGYHVGEKDCIQKWHLWDESTRVPLFIHVPGAKGNGRTCEHPVSLIDMYPTLADMCGLGGRPRKGADNTPLAGRSLRPLLENPERKESHGPSVAFMGIRDGKAPPHFSVRSRRYRYTLCGNGQEELYDHDKDPHEWTNLAGDPEHAETKKQLRKELMSVLQATKTPKGFKPK
ncbi:MAG: sulfatase [Phycisphaerae bacterium]|jgi:arylsulfatase A-like enzyme|nr:sulfatase [Phycisphaerae bacterium]